MVFFGKVSVVDVVGMVFDVMDVDWFYVFSYFKLLVFV